MIFTSSKSILGQALKVAARGVKLRSPLPVTQCVRIQTTDTGSDVPVRLFSTDTELAIHTQLRADVKQAGEVCAPMKRLAEIVNSLTSQELKFTCDEALRITVASGRSVFKLSGVDAREMPVSPQIADKTGLAIPEGLLRSMFAKTAYAVSKDDTRPRLTGACMTLSGNTMELAATDAHTLALYRQEFSDHLEHELRVVVPRETMLELLNLADQDSDRPASLWIDSNTIAIQVGENWIMSRLIAGEYPQYWSFIPDTVETSVVVDRESLIEVFKRVQIIARDDLNKVFCKFEQGLLSMETNSGDDCFTEELAIEHEGNPLEIILNVGQTLAILSSFDGDAIFMGMNGPLKPVLFRPMESEEYFAVGMPMNSG